MLIIFFSIILEAASLAVVTDMVVDTLVGTEDIVGSVGMEDTDATVVIVATVVTVATVDSADLAATTTRNGCVVITTLFTTWLQMRHETIKIFLQKLYLI